MINQPRNKITAVVAAFALASLLSSPDWAQTTAPKLDLASADWSVRNPHNLSSNPPPADVVWAFVNYHHDIGHLCDFRFADLRHSGDLSLVVVIDAGATAGCTGTQIFDKTDSGFVHYYTPAEVRDDLRKSIQDINHDGKYELILWGDLASSETQGLSCGAEWPIIFAWNGVGYADVSSQYKEYYERHLDSLDKQIAASFGSEEGQKGAVIQTPRSASKIFQDRALDAEAASGHGGSRSFPGPAALSSDIRPTDASAGTQDRDCKRIEAAKAEAFLGIHSDATMNAAIKDSESEDPNRRILAAVLFSYIGSQEAKTDLKTLANDSDPAVANLAKSRLRGEQDSGDYQFDQEQVPKAFLRKQ